MSDTVDLRDVRGRLVRFLFAIPLGVATTSVVLGALPNEGESSMVLDGLIFAIVSSFAWAAAFGYFYRKSEAVRELRRTRAGALLAILGSGVRVPISRRRSASFGAAVRQLGVSLVD